MASTIKVSVLYLNTLKMQAYWNGVSFAAIWYSNIVQI